MPPTQPHPPNHPADSREQDVLVGVPAVADDDGVRLAVHRRVGGRKGGGGGRVGRVEKGVGGEALAAWLVGLIVFGQSGSRLVEGGSWRFGLSTAPTSGQIEASEPKQYPPPWAAPPASFCMQLSTE
jgi:hypothetical protein